MNKRLWNPLFTALFHNLFGNKASSSVVTKYFLSLLPAVLLASIHCAYGMEIDRQEILKKYYLSKFTDLEHNAVSTHEKLSPLRTRTMLEHYLLPEFCPECDTHNTTNRSVQFHTDVWQDTQVFQTPGKAHVYDMAFPGTSTLGEFYGAYLLVYGATWSDSKISHRKNLIKALKDNNLRRNLQSNLKTLNQHLDKGLALFIREHPFNHLLDASALIDESIPVKLLQDDNSSNIREPCSGFSELNGYKNITNPNICSLLDYNFNGHYSLHFQYIAYAESLLAVSSICFNYRFKKRSRELNYYSENNKLHGIVNWLIFSAKADSWADLATIPLSLALSIQRTYEHHWDKKKLNEDMARRLLEFKPFIEALFNFYSFQDLPDINFFLNKSEIKLVSELRIYMNQISTGGHLYQHNLARIVASVRRILALRETIIRLLANAAKLDFYLSVAEGIGNHRRWSFVKFDKNDYGRIQEGPGITARSLWNPLLPAHQAVASNLTLGDTAPRNIILSGANASGKSTFLRSVGINTIFFAQTLGIAAAKTFHFRPFTHFDSLIDKRDQKGRSSYEGEKETVGTVWKYNYQLKEQSAEGKRVLVIADELFRTTNPHTGAAVSKRLVAKLGAMPHTTALISTHFDKLHELGEEHPELFANKHMKADYDEQAGGITSMRFQLTDGVCPHTNAIQMFEEELEQNYPELFEY
ncbi:MutS-related protein [Endozoicomonas numazuensis]|uniref:DNA mismatch repair proteins mutS family domain-containing protein n=1 Tax=Endozoicomonas numazuensis TaxID=1137799 RepID=A0A081N179_9GAMM|nr:hypothetical protein [Endozoicomonas numazuensis]KEQ12202.1 hypothetical protein GZ78_27580 [Endozoicomonas numazuensis]